MTAEPTEAALALGIRISFDRADARWCTVEGELDIFSVGDLDRALDGFAASGETSINIVADKLMFIDCTGFEALLRHDRQLRKVHGRLLVVDPTRPVARLLALLDARWMIDPRLHPRTLATGTDELRRIR